MNREYHSYEDRKRNINWMLKFYSRCLIDDARCGDLTLDELELLLQYDQEMIAAYQGDLLVLEAKKLLGLIN